MIDVINDILDFSRLEHDALQLECIPFSVVDLFTSLQRIFKYSAEQQGVELSFCWPDDLSTLQVEGDPTRLRQILVNLLSNALKFTQQGSVSLNLHWMRWELSRFFCSAALPIRVLVLPPSNCRIFSIPSIRLIRLFLDAMAALGLVYPLPMP